MIARVIARVQRDSWCLSLIALGVMGLTSCSMFDAKPAADSGFNPTTAPQATRAAFLQQIWVA